MQLIRTIVWVLILVGLLAFSFFNWRPVEVTIWENLVLETKVPALVVVSFLLGLIPMWLYHRGAKWRLERRISSLEAAAESHRRLTTPAAQTDGAAAPTPPASRSDMLEAQADNSGPAPAPVASSARTGPSDATLAENSRKQDPGPLTSNPD